MSLDRLKSWTLALKAHGFTPAALHLDVNQFVVEASPELHGRLVGDLQKMKAFFHAQGIPFGIIFWSGHGPQKSDKEYSEYTLAWARTVHAAIGRPDEIIFSSWVERCSQTGACNAHSLGCLPSDPDYCGKKSVPINLPENDPHIFSHTRLINETLAILNGP
jgi:hypothetical protein